MGGGRGRHWATATLNPVGGVQGWDANTPRVIITSANYKYNIREFKFVAAPFTLQACKSFNFFLLFVVKLISKSINANLFILSE